LQNFVAPAQFVADLEHGRAGIRAEIAAGSGRRRGSSSRETCGCYRSIVIRQRSVGIARQRIGDRVRAWSRTRFRTRFRTGLRAWFRNGIRVIRAGYRTKIGYGRVELSGVILTGRLRIARRTFPRKWSPHPGRRGVLGCRFFRS